MSQIDTFDPKPLGDEDQETRRAMSPSTPPFPAFKFAGTSGKRPVDERVTAVRPFITTRSTSMPPPPTACTPVAPPRARSPIFTRLHRRP